MNILITGASRGLGLALAQALAAEGHTLIINARGAAELEKAAQIVSNQTTVYAIAGDISDREHQAALQAVVANLGSLDILINNAGILGPSPQPYLLDYPAAELARVFTINVFAQLQLIQMLRPFLHADAQILNISSDAAVGAYAGWGGYGSAKAALDHLTAILAEEQPTWRVYSVDPGDMNTVMHQQAFPDEDISDRPAPEASVPGILALIQSDLPSGRYVAKSLYAKTDQTLRVVLNVQDYEAAVRLYRDGAKLNQVDQWDDATGRGVVLAAGQVELEILDQQHTLYVDTSEVGQASSGPLRLAWRVADLQSAVDRLREYGADQITAPIHTPWGHQAVRLAGADQQPITVYVDEGGLA